jgi:iron complex outermembrane recepter protein
LSTGAIQDSKETTKTAKVELKGSFDTGPVEHTLLLAYDDLRAKTETGFETTFLAVTNLETGVRTDVTADLGPVLGAPSPRSVNSTKPKESGLLIYDHLIWGSWVALVGWREMRFEQGDPLNPDQPAFRRGLPSFGVVYRATPTLSFYGSASKGFKPNIGLIQADGAALPPENSKQAELGFKSQLFDRQLALTGAAFEIKQSNVAVADFDNSPPTTLYWVSVPGVKVRGLELELSGNLTPRLSLRAAYAYLDKRATTTLRDGGGIVFARHQASLWSSYRFGDTPGSGWWLGAGLQGRSSALGRADPEAIPAPGEYRIDVNGGYQAKQWSFVLGVKNALDERLYTLSSRGDQSGTLVQPREFYATARYSF